MAQANIKIDTKTVLLSLLLASMITATKIKIPGRPTRFQTLKNCTIFDRVHFRKIDFWSDSFPATQMSMFDHGGVEVYFSFCNRFPENLIKKCGFKEKDMSSYFFVRIEDGICQPLTFSHVRWISYSTVDIPEIGAKCVKQIRVEFFVDGVEHSITFPDFSIKKIHYCKQNNLVEIKVPLGLNLPVEGKVDGPQVRDAFLWQFELYSREWWLLSLVRTVYTIWAFMAYKLGQKMSFFKFRPFDFVMNFQLFSVVFCSVVEILEDTDGLSNSIVVGFVPVLFAVLINWRTPSFSWRVSASKSNLI